MRYGPREYVPVIFVRVIGHCPEDFVREFYPGVVYPRVILGIELVTNQVTKGSVAS